MGDDRDPIVESTLAMYKTRTAEMMEKIKQKQKMLQGFSRHPNKIIRITYVVCVCIVVLFFVPMVVSGLLRGLLMTRTKDVKGYIAEKNGVLAAILIIILLVLLKKANKV